MLATIPYVSKVERTKSWYLILRCISVKGMQKLSKQGLFCGDKIHELEFSENNIFEKVHWSKFTKGLRTSKQVLDYVHADFSGPCLGFLF